MTCPKKSRVGVNSLSHSGNPKQSFPIYILIHYCFFIYAFPLIIPNKMKEGKQLKKSRENEILAAIEMKEE